MSCKLAKLGWLLGAGVLVTSVGRGQPADSQSYPGGTAATTNPAPFYGGGFGGYGYNTMGAGSTPAGSYMTGMANAIRAQGEYNLNTSAATINLEEAQKRDIENRTRWTNAYFEMRRINDAYTHPPKPATPPTTWARMAHEALPPRLSSSMLDPVSGQIAWPAALQVDAFKSDRDVLDSLFSQRATSQGAIGVDGHAKIRKTVDDALAKLKEHIRDFDTRNYLDARNFLTSLAYEANFPAAG
jgi:hypothetical protein